MTGLITNPADRDRVRKHLGAERRRWELLALAHERTDRRVHEIARHYADCLADVQARLIGETDTSDGDHG